MVSPSMLLIALVAAYPIIYAIWLSLHEYSVRVAGLSRWAGLNNYTEAFSNPDFWDAMVTTLVFTAVTRVARVRDRARDGAACTRRSRARDSCARSCWCRGPC